MQHTKIIFLIYHKHIYHNHATSHYNLYFMYQKYHNHAAYHNNFVLVYQIRYNYNNNNSNNNNNNNIYSQRENEE